MTGLARNRKATVLTWRSLAGIAVGCLLTASAPTQVAAQTVTHVRYRPFACAQAAIRSEKQLGRSIPDTSSTPLPSRSLRAETVRELQECVEDKFTEQLPARQLIGLGDAYLAAGNDAKAGEAYRKAIAFAAREPIERRAWSMAAIVRSYATAKPARFDSAVVLASAIDTLGSRAAVGRLRAHNAIYTAAMQIDSVPLMTTESRAAVAASEALVADDRRQWAPESKIAFEGKAVLEGRLGNGPAAVATLQEAANRLGALRESVRGSLLVLVGPYTFYGKPAVPIQSMYSALPGKPVTTAPLSITPNKVSLLVFVDMGCNFNECFSAYASIRRLAEKYSTRGLQVLLVTHTQGWDREWLVPDPTDEAERIRAFFHDYVEIPAPIVIWKSEFEKQADGSMKVVTLPNDLAYTGNPQGAERQTAVLIDKSGTIRAEAVIGPKNETRFDRMIGALLP